MVKCPVKKSKGYKSHKKGIKTKHYQKDNDQLHQDLEKGVILEQDEELPGQGKFYCVSCAKYFIDLRAQQLHETSKPHKRKLKELKKGVPYTIEESLKAAGIGIAKRV